MKLSTLDNSLQLLDLLSKHPQGLSLMEISEMAGFNKSTAHHILNTFIPYDYVSQDSESKKYSLGFQFLAMSRIILDNMDLQKIAHKFLVTLHEKCGEAVHLAVLRNGKFACIDKIQKPDGLTLATYIGFTTEPHAAAGGKVLLSELNPQQIKDIYRRRPLKVYGKNTITNMAQLLEELDSIRKQGYAIDNEEYYEGVRCVSAPIRGGGKIIAAVSVTGSIFSISMERINRELIPMVIHTAKEISAVMQW